MIHVISINHLLLNVSCILISDNAITVTTGLSFDQKQHHWSKSNV